MSSREGAPVRRPVRHRPQPCPWPHRTGMSECPAGPSSWLGWLFFREHEPHDATTAQARHMTLAVIYSRISHDPEGRQAGVERQEQDCRHLAAERGWLVLEPVYRENDVSASTRSKKRRPVFEQMLSDLSDRSAGVLLTYSTSRLTRRPLEYERLIELTSRTGLEIHTVVSGPVRLDTADGRALARVLAVIDAAEAERTSERVSRAKLQRAEQGLWHGGPCTPFGYRYAADPSGRGLQLVIDPVRARLVREACRRALADSLAGICKDWNARGLVTSTGVAWRPQGIRKMLVRPSTAGMTERAGQAPSWGVAGDPDPAAVGRCTGRPARPFAGQPDLSAGRQALPARGASVLRIVRPPAGQQPAAWRAVLHLQPDRHWGLREDPHPGRLPGAVPARADPAARRRSAGVTRAGTSPRRASPAAGRPLRRACRQAGLPAAEPAPSQRPAALPARHILATATARGRRQEGGHQKGAGTRHRAAAPGRSGRQSPGLGKALRAAERPLAAALVVGLATGAPRCRTGHRLLRPPGDRCVIAQRLRLR